MFKGCSNPARFTHQRHYQQGRQLEITPQGYAYLEKELSASSLVPATLGINSVSQELSEWIFWKKVMT